MIFRRSNELSSSKNGLTAARNTANTARREPEIANRSTAAGYAAPGTSAPISPVAGQTMTPQTPQNPMSLTPSSSLNRRPQGAPSATGFNRTEQLRKLTVGRDISLNGEITTCDHLIVEGNVAATIKGGQVLEISETGTFSGLVDIEQADIAGVFDGELTVRGKLILRPTAVVTGLVRYGRLQVDAGATLNGQIGMLPEQATQQEQSPIQMPQQAPTQQPTNQYNNGPLASINDQPGFLKASA